MTKLRQLWLLTALGSVAVLALGYFLLVTPKANQASSLRSDTQAQVLANQKLQSDIAQLTKQSKDKPRLQGLLEAFATKIPNNPALPALVRSLTDAADNSGVELVSVAPSAPVLAAAAPAAGTTGTVTAAAAAPAGLTLAHIPVVVSVKGSYSQISQFLAEIEGLSRAFLVSGVDVKPYQATAATAGTTATTTVQANLLTAALTGRLFMTANVAPPAPVRPVVDSTK
jgi:Tfp pilus assembly protein PilO